MFRSSGLLRNHRLTQHPVPMDGEEAEDSTKTYRCGKCGRGFEEEAELLQHQENHAGDRYCNGSAAIKRRGRPPKTEAVEAGEKKAKQKEEEAEGPEETNHSEDTSAKPATADVKTAGTRTPSQIYPGVQGRR